MITSSLSLFSQNATPTVEYIKIPVPVVKNIVVDLVKGDSAKAQLKLLVKRIQRVVGSKKKNIFSFSR